MDNAAYDFKNASAFTPYIDAGLGVAHGAAKLNALGSTVKLSDTVFAYQLGGGVAYAVTDNISLTGDYRFIDTAKFDKIDDDYTAHELRVGARYSF